MVSYYNDIEPSAILWLEQAIREGYIPEGDIDSRPIQEIHPDDLKGYDHHHFFAGIGGWALALREAGWPDNKPVWTGSCPCQPFSTAGRQKGQADERHLWPVWGKLIREYGPATIFGEQVANAITKGWLDEVYDDLESEGYACASAVLPACSIGAPHRRDRLWFVAHCAVPHDTGRPSEISEPAQRETEQRPRPPRYTQFSGPGSLGNIKHNGFSSAAEPESHAQTNVYCAEGTNRARQPARASTPNFVSEPTEWVLCPDGRARAIKSGLRLLDYGVPKELREPTIHGFGNAIVPGVAAEFISAFMETQI